MRIYVLEQCLQLNHAFKRAQSVSQRWQEIFLKFERTYRQQWTQLLGVLLAWFSFIMDIPLEADCNKLCRIFVY